MLLMIKILNINYQRIILLLGDKKGVKSVLECAPISIRIISIRLAAKPQNMSIVQVYAPMKASDKETLEQFSNELEESIRQIPRKDIFIVQRDWNAKIAREAYDLWKGTIGKLGLGHTTIDDNDY